jgi:hypothetical protein
MGSYPQSRRISAEVVGTAFRQFESRAGTFERVINLLVVHPARDETPPGRRNPVLANPFGVKPGVNEPGGCTT